MRPVAFFILLATNMTASAQPVVSAPETRESTSLTVYNGGFAVVREVRTIPLRRGLMSVRFEGVPARIDPTSLSLASLSSPGSVSVREQNYQYNLVSTQSVLDAAVGQRIRLVRQIGETTVVDEGVLISQPGQGRIVRLDDGRVLVDPAGTIELTTLPDGLLSRPSLLWQLDSAVDGPQRLEARYLTDGITWEADYVAVVNDDETALDLTGWVTLDNQSGTSYRQAALQLIAGDVRRVQPPRPPMMARGEVAMYDAVAVQAAPTEEAFFEYHLYTFPNPTDIAERETKQMELLSAQAVGTSRRLIIDATGQYFPFYRPARPGETGEERSAAVVMTVANTDANRMGMPLPAGTVRVYKVDARGALQFLGEDRIEHTPRGETLRLYVGDAFDVVGTRREVSSRQISNREREVTVEIEVRNRKQTAAEVDVVERAFYGDWRIVSATVDGREAQPERLDARTAQWSLSLGADETATVRYTARIR
ncbi:MAG TPA: DUF4139 domain-containing protein [Rubricoccaceae bacterium]|jgi:hypothetical protein